MRRRGSYTQSSPKRQSPGWRALQATPRVSNVANAIASRGCAIGPQDELERLIIGLAGVESRLDHGAALRVVRARAPRQAQGVAKHHHVLLAPLVEMPKPQLFVDELRQFADRGAFVRRAS